MRLGDTSLAYWLPPIVWMAVIMALSSEAFSAQKTGRVLLPLLAALLRGATPPQLDAIHALLRKLGHLTEYAILGALWFRAWADGARRSPRVAAWIAFLLSVSWAFLDELHQATTVTRGPSAADVALDGVGALLTLAIARHRRERRSRVAGGWRPPG